MTAGITAEPAIVADRVGSVLTLRLNQPETRNALSEAIKNALVDHLEDFAKDDGIRCLVLTGNGTSFCAGGDIRSMAAGSTPLESRRRMQRNHKWLGLLLQSEKPVVMAVNGAAVGAGFGLALTGDIVIASDKASFLAGFTGIGVVPDYGLGLTLPRAVGTVRASDILMSNRRVKAPEALDIGLVSRLYPADRLDEEALALAQMLASAPTVALGLTKRLVSDGFVSTVADYLDREAYAQAIAFSTEDHRAGVAAFLGKTEPRFEGR